MDKERSRNRSAEISSMTSQNQQRKELNGNVTSTYLGKRKKVREKKSNYLQDWLDKSLQQDYCDGDTNQIENLMTNMWLQPPQQNCRGFHYNVPPQLGYSAEPMSLPPLNHQYQFPTSSPIIRPQPILPVQRNFLANRNRNSKKSLKIPAQQNIYHNSIYENTWGLQESPELQFASLPQVEINPSPVIDDSQNTRRFSDPGIGPDGEPQGQSDTDDSNSSPEIELSLPNKKLIMALLDQVNALKKSNTRVFRELHETKVELERLKHQSLNWSRRDSINGSNATPFSSLSGQAGTGYVPGMLSDVVREVRDAARIREEVLISRVRAMVEDSTSYGGTSLSMTNAGSMHGSMNGQDYSDRDRDRSNKEIGDIKMQLQQAMSEKSQTLERLEKVEDELQKLRINPTPSYTYSSPPSRLPVKEEPLSSPQVIHQVLSESQQEREMEREMLQLRRELQQEVASRKEAEASRKEAEASKKEAEATAHKLERLVTILRKKINNGVSVDDPPSPGGNGKAPMANSESLSSGSYPSSPLNGPLSGIGHGSSTGVTLVSHPHLVNASGMPITMSGPVTDLMNDIALTGETML